MAQDTPPVAPTPSKDLLQMSIGDLMNLQVTSGAKKEEPLQRTAAALFLITSEDIRRSGATTLPDVLRMVPGLEVAQINGSVWAISSRGLNDEFSNKMLVLIDGRTVYSPVFSGVLWEEQDMLLADIERIEVIRGPGAALWGTNAVNGVINVITKRAEQTKGAAITAAAGNTEGGYGSVQYGGKLWGRGFYRVFVKGFSKESVASVAGEGPQNGWDLEHGGFRADWTLNARDTLTVEGDLFRSFAQQTTTFTTSLTPLVSDVIAGMRRAGGGNLIERWRRVLSPRSEVSLQAYFDHTSVGTDLIQGKVDTLDVELQHTFAIGDRQDIVWGADYRMMRIETIGSVAVSLSPANIVEGLGSAFIQDGIDLVPAHLRLTLGARVQKDYITGVSFQPDVRLLWTPRPRQAVWLAASRALRGLTVADAGVHNLQGAMPTATGLPLVVESVGNPDMRTEAEKAYQVGYRAGITPSLSVDTAVFYNAYSRLRGSQATGLPTFEGSAGPPFLLLPVTLNNAIAGEAHGVEISSTWKPMSDWKVSAGYTWLGAAFHDSSPGAPPDTTASQLKSPHRQFSIRSNLDLPHRFEFDAALYRVGRIDPVVAEPYVRLDARLGWRVGRHVEVSVVGQNLLTNKHMEFNNESDWVEAAAVGRSFYAKMTWRFGEASPAQVPR